jgi:hypothetical protein
MYTAGYLQSKLRKYRRAGLRRILLDEVSMLDGDQLTVLVRRFGTHAGQNETELPAV